MGDKDATQGRGLVPANPKLPAAPRRREQWQVVQFTTSDGTQTFGCRPLRGGMRRRDIFFTQKAVDVEFNFRMASMFGSLAAVFMMVCCLSMDKSSWQQMWPMFGVLGVVLMTAAVFSWPATMIHNHYRKAVDGDGGGGGGATMRWCSRSLQG